MALLRTHEAAKYLGLKKATLEAWRCRGGGPAFIRYGGKGAAVRYCQAVLDAFIAAHMQNNTYVDK
ncbi:MAG TPA: helix-turn-helix domain-containing protein [Syntrophales bacterium]|jgi:hypothetical protein|nr:helix-turn-helix domain-containing protein [Syntrophales bacterium]